MPNRAPVDSLPGLLAAARRCAELARASGSLQPIATLPVEVDMGDVRLRVHLLQGVERRDLGEREARLRGVNPFLPYDESLYVADLGSEHVCVLNKFNVMDDHLLIITREFVPQETPLCEVDFVALALAMNAVDGLGFYNSGAEAGASQPHRHLQLVPWQESLEDLAITRRIAAGGSPQGVGGVAGWGFVHGLVRLSSDLWQAPEVAGGSLYRIYLDLRSQLGLTGEWDPYNLLVTRSWLLLVPRTTDSFKSIEVNSLGLAGSLFARRPEDVEVIREHGWDAMLAAVTRAS